MTARPPMTETPLEALIAAADRLAKAVAAYREFQTTGTKPSTPNVWIELMKAEGAYIRARAALPREVG